MDDGSGLCSGATALRKAVEATARRLIRDADESVGNDAGGGVGDDGPGRDQFHGVPLVCASFSILLNGE